MIYTRYNSGNNVLIGNVAENVNFVAIAKKAEAEIKEAKINKDTFEYRTTESTQTYFPDLISKSVNSASSINAASPNDGTNTKWENHGATRITANEEDALLAVDAQLQLGNPAIVRLYSPLTDQHWVTIIGKKDNDYTIIDPYDGKEKLLSNNIHYKENDGYITDYVILSNEY